ncbi:MAG: hypothetical protein ACK559_04825, partial [bacterium]
MRLSHFGHPVRLHIAEKSFHRFPVLGADHHVRSAEVHLSRPLLRRIPRGGNLQHARDPGQEAVQLSSRRVARPHLTPIIGLLREPQPGRGVGRQTWYGHVPCAYGRKPY